MPIIYRVTVTSAKKEETFRICWRNVETKNEKSFEASGPGIPQKEMERLRQHLAQQLEMGRELFGFLDGKDHVFQAALDEAARHGESLQLHLCPCPETANWPFELLAKESAFLLPHRLHLVRCVSEWGADKMFEPEDRPLKLMFMACSALEVKPELDFEKEEELIFRITEKLAVDMEVEDSGSLEGLGEQLEQAQYDVVHLSGHADIDENGRPFFIMEDETGYACKVFPGDLWQEALIENPPRLLFLSGCRTGEVPENGATVSFARRLVEEYHMPAVLGWGRSVTDKQATVMAMMLYRELSRGKSILEAVQRARYEVITNFPSDRFPAWYLLRLFGSGVSLNALVKEGQKMRPKPRRMVHMFLKRSRVQVLAEGFVGRRRQLQQCLRTMKQNFDKVGVLLHGIGGLGKSCLAGKLCERFSDFTLIIVHGRLNAITLETALKDAFIAAGDEKGEAILSVKAEMTERLAKLCASCFKERNYLLLLDDFEQNLGGAEQGGPGGLLLEAVDLVKILLHYLPLSGKMTHLVITSRYLFTLVDQGIDLIKERLEPVCLTSFQESEQRKKARELNHILNYPDTDIAPQLLASGRGNPRLMEWLDVLVGEMEEVEVPQLLDAIRDKQEEFIRKHVIRELLLRGGDDLVRLLCWLSIYRRLVPMEGVKGIGEKAGLEGWEKLLGEGMRLSLVEHDRAYGSYGVTPLLREELLSDLDDPRVCHEAAFAYYKKVCDSLEHFDPLLAEEWVYHALGCGEEDVASREGGAVVKSLREHLAYQESKRVGLWILEKKKCKLSTEHDAFLLSEVAGMLNELGDYSLAIAYYEQTLNILKKVCGEKHQDYASTLNNIGLVWSYLNDHQKAINYTEQALNIDKTLFGQLHPNVARDLNNLGSAWKKSGDLPKAIGYFEQALNIDEKFFGREHAEVAVDLNNLGSILYDQGDHRKAIKYYEKALNIISKVYGEKHPQVAASLNNLGLAWKALGEPKKAINYHQQALSIWMDVYGEKHPQVANGLDTLGVAWVALGDHRKAIDYFEQALFIGQSVHGKEHPFVIRVLNNLGSVWEILGESKKAIYYFEWALTTVRVVFGEKHTYFATTLNNLGTGYFTLGQKEKAKEYFEKAYAIFKKSFGEGHQLTKTAAEWLKEC